MTTQQNEYKETETTRKNGAMSNGTSSLPEISPPGTWNVIRRNHQSIPFDSKRIFRAIEKAYINDHGEEMAHGLDMQSKIKEVTDMVEDSLIRRYPQGGHIPIEEIQDNVIARLIDAEQRSIAQSYSSYRRKRQEQREHDALMQLPKDPVIEIVGLDGNKKAVDWEQLDQHIEEACQNVLDISIQDLRNAIKQNIRHGMPEHELKRAIVDTATDMIKVDPNYDTVASRLLLIQLREECLEELAIPIAGRVFSPNSHSDLDEAYTVVLQRTLEYGSENELLDPRLLEYDLVKLGSAIVAERDLQFDFHGLQVIYDRYLQQNNGIRFELPQVFWMRVAMFLAINETDRDDKAIEFYDTLSSFRFISSTPTLFNAGTLHPQLSSCYISTVEDNLESIFGAQIFSNAMLQKWAGGMGNDWTPVRALGSEIKGTNGKSDGVVPFIKVVDATAKAVNQGGKRAGAVCSYLETWHLDIEEFLDLRKNTGDHMRRTPNMNTANWIPDLFMKRIEANADWTLFSPSDVSDLHDLYGRAFEERYEEYERATETGEIKLFKRVRANDLWRSMLRALAETGHPWMTFKDTCNIRSPQSHVGRVHSSNLCTEITLNTSSDEIAVCNLGSLNLKKHADQAGYIDQEQLRQTVRTAIRMLDNVIDINFYAIDKASNSNMRHRPIGLGLMGFQDVLYLRRTPYDSDEAIQFADESMEWISYYAIEASSDLAVERGRYESFEGSLWSKGILPIDSLRLLQEERGEEFVLLDLSQTMDWAELREKVVRQGMRNSNVMAIAPTATIANIVGSVASIEPFFLNTFVKQNMSGEFQVVNPYLTNDLKSSGLWSEELFKNLLDFDGDLDCIPDIPDTLKQLYRSAFDVGNPALIECAARRQKWIDQSQSLNLYVDPNRGVEPREVRLWYQNAWRLGLKTTYYLHSRGATSVEKTSSVDERLRYVVADTVSEVDVEVPTGQIVDNGVESADDEQAYEFCDVNDPTCESCAG